jgi:hypothetical protein
MRLYRISSKRNREPEDRRVYLQDINSLWTWTASAAHADQFPRDVALRMAKFIRRQWRMPARVEPV